MFMDNIKFGETISKLRKEKNMTQKELAEKLNITDKAVSKWERGVSFPDITLLETLSKTLGISMSELITNENDDKNIDIENKARELINEMNLIKKKKRNKVIKRLFILLIIVGVLIAIPIISALNFFTLNPIRALIGYIQIEKMGKDYVEVGTFPDKVIYARNEVNLNDYMRSQGFEEIEEERMGYGLVFTNGKINQYVSNWGEIDGYPFQIWLFQGTSEVKKDSNLVMDETQIYLNDIYFNGYVEDGAANSIN